MEVIPTFNVATFNWIYIWFTGFVSNIEEHISGIEDDY